jgi:EAL and modified HD-GYP domain-containing signal transduction protein
MGRDSLIGRHPIFSPNLEVVGYEVRSPAIDGFFDTDGDDVARAVYTSLGGAALDHLVGNLTGFINLTHQALAGGYWRRIPRERVVFSVFDTDLSAPDMAVHLRDILRQGGRIALPERVHSDEFRDLQAKAHVIRLNVAEYRPDELEACARELKSRGLRTIAAGVDTYDDLEFARELGFDLIQGRFLSKPANKDRTGNPVNRLALLRVLARLQEPDIAVRKLDKLISQDVALTCKLLQYANSPRAAVRREVDSIGHALRLVGTKKLQSWSSVLLLSAVEDKPRELIVIALVRGRMCELLANAVKKQRADSYFSAGLLSVLDALADRPMEDLLAEIPLVDEIKDGILHRTGPIGQALRCAVAYERAEWSDVAFYGLSAALIQEIYMDSIKWARDMSLGLVSPMASAA